MGESRVKEAPCVPSEGFSSSPTSHNQITRKQRWMIGRTDRIRMARFFMRNEMTLEITWQGSRKF